MTIPNSVLYSATTHSAQRSHLQFTSPQNVGQQGVHSSRQSVLVAGTIYFHDEEAEQRRTCKSKLPRFTVHITVQRRIYRVENTSHPQL